MTQAAAMTETTPAYDCTALIKAIDAYIAKADERLADKLDKAGFVDAKETVDAATALEDSVTDALDADLSELVSAVGESDSLDDFAEHGWPDVRDDGALTVSLSEAFEDAFDEQIPKLATAYIRSLDAELIAATISRRTTDWARSWSTRLGELMKLSTNNQIENLLTDSLQNGRSVAQLTEAIMDSGIRDTRYKARRAAITEMLRAHSVAREESIMQNPAVDEKEWVHAGSYRNDPRPGHVALNGVVVPKNQPFTLIGADGVTYSPMYPRDVNLPAGESVNCHCLHRGIASAKMFGVSLEERRRLQQEAIDADDGEWRKELDARNKARSGITSPMPDAKRGIPTELGRVGRFTTDEQIKYMGGKQKWALYKSGVIADDDMLLHVRRTTLKNLNAEGIITINTKTLNHSNVGEFTPKSGRMISGGHGQANIDELNRRGIGYKIEKAYSNGVRIGGVERHKDKPKQPGMKGQSWFPDGWSKDDILVAGTRVANTQRPTTGSVAFDDYDGVRVGIVFDDKGGGTVYPDKLKQPLGDGWEQIDD